MTLARGRATVAGKHAHVVDYRQSCLSRPVVPP
jgi:hypothetical protein